MLSAGLRALDRVARCGCPCFFQQPPGIATLSRLIGELKTFFLEIYCHVPDADCGTHAILPYPYSWSALLVTNSLESDRFNDRLKL